MHKLKIWYEYPKDDPSFKALEEAPIGAWNQPVCLVPPELLEWAIKARDYIQCESSDWCQMMLAEFEKIWPEGK